MKRKTITAFITITVVFGGMLFVLRKLKSNATREKCNADKNMAQFNMMDRWVQNLHNNKAIEDYLLKKGINMIAIYGMGTVGRTLLEELSQSKVKVKFAFDINATNSYYPYDLEIFQPDDVFPQVDAVIVTLPNAFESISRMLKSKVQCPVLSVQDIIYEL